MRQFLQLILGKALDWLPMTFLVGLFFLAGFVRGMDHKAEELQPILSQVQAERDQWRETARHRQATLLAQGDLAEACLARERAAQKDEAERAAILALPADPAPSTTQDTKAPAHVEKQHETTRRAAVARYLNRSL